MTDIIYKSRIGEPAVYKQVVKRYMMCACALHHLLDQHTFRHHVFLQSLGINAILVSGLCKTSFVLLCCQALRLLALLAILSQQTLLKPKNRLSIAPTHCQSLETKYAALSYMREYPADVLNVKSCFWQVRAIHDKNRGKA